jgi:Beta-propeller repeat
MQKLSYASLLWLCTTATAFAQQATEIDAQTVRFPRYANFAAIQAIPSPQQGMTVYNIATQSQWHFNGTIWVNSTAVVPPLNLTSNVTTITGTTTGNGEVGVLGQSSSAGKAIGVKGVIPGPNNTDTATAVWGQNFSSSGYAVRGTSTARGWAGRFEGNNALQTSGAVQLRTPGVGTPANGKVLMATDNQGSAEWRDYIPRLTTEAIEALSSPQIGDMAYDLTFRCLKQYNGVKWLCTHQSPDQPTPVLTAWRAGGTLWDSGSGISIDPSGNVYVTGWLEGSGTFGNTNVTSAGGRDIFVAKYTASGTLLWVRLVGGSLPDFGNSITLDGSNNVYVTGTFEGTATFNTTTLTSAGDSDIFLAKYDTDGNFLWAVRAGGPNDDGASGVAVKSNGEAYITGSFSGSASFGGIPVSSAGTKSFYAAKCSSAGVFQAVQMIGGNTSDGGTDIVLDASGMVYVTGSFEGTATFGATTLTSAGDKDIFVAKYDPTAGTWTWARQAGGTQTDVGTSITLNSFNQLIVVGYFDGTATFGSSTLVSQGGGDVFMAMYSNNNPPSSTPVSLHRGGGTGFEECFGVTTDTDDNIYFTGHFEGTATFGSTTISSSNNSDDNVFVVKYNKSGIFQWVKQAGGTDSDVGTAIKADVFGNIYLTGSFIGTSAFGATVITSAGAARDIFVARMKE